jgi:predicted ferric reductase
MKISTMKEQLIAEEIDSLTSQIFAMWDSEGDGIVFSDDILAASGVEEVEFGLALARILGLVFPSPSPHLVWLGNDNSGQIYKDNLRNVLRVLLYGRIEDKVSIFVKFMIRDSSGNISFETIQSYLKISSSQSKILNKLGLVDEKGAQLKESLQYEDILDLFLSSASSQPHHNGTEAINIFCRQILRVLTKHLRPHKKTRSLFLPPLPASESTGLQLLFSRVQYYFSPPRLYLLFLLCLQLFLWLLNFTSYRSHGYPLAFCLAKGFGLNLRVLTLCLFFTMARSTLNLLSSVPRLKPFLFPGDNIPVHSFLGFCTLFHSLGHTAMHVAYQMTYRPNGFAQSFKQRSLLKLLFHGKQHEYSTSSASGDDSVLSGDGITGMVLLAMILLMSVTALMRGLSSSCYSLFTHTHFLYLLWLLFITLHVPLLWPYFAAIALLLLCDRLYDSLFLTIHSSLAFSRSCHNGVTFLSIPHSLHSVNHAVGAYYRIQIPSLAPLEWHPFSLAGSTTSHHLSFFIASSGDWTRRLYQLVGDPVARSGARVTVQGPYYAPAKEALSNRTATVLLVASGIGITPFFSVIATKVTDEYVHESGKAPIWRVTTLDSSALRRRPRAVL